MELNTEKKSRAYFNWFVSQLKRTLQTRLICSREVVRNDAVEAIFSRLRKMKAVGLNQAEEGEQYERKREENLHIEQTRMDLDEKSKVGQYDYQFDRDHATSIIEVYPEATRDIFPEGIDGYYLSRKAGRWNLQLIDWFVNKLESENVFDEYGTWFINN